MVGLGPLSVTINYEVLVHVFLIIQSRIQNFFSRWTDSGFCCLVDRRRNNIRHSLGCAVVFGYSMNECSTSEDLLLLL